MFGCCVVLVGFVVVVVFSIWWWMCVLLSWWRVGCVWVLFGVVFLVECIVFVRLA